MQLFENLSYDKIVDVIAILSLLCKLLINYHHNEHLCCQGQKYEDI